jgi:PRTRC genetic system protein B
MSDSVALHPIRAVVFHASDTGQSVAMDHPIALDPETGTAMLREGSPMSRAAIGRMVDDLADGAGPQRATVLPECLLAWTRNVMAWWRPTQRRPILFETKTPLDEISGKHVTHPALLFVARPPADERARLFVYALADPLSHTLVPSNARPSGETLLWRAPYFNVYDSGFMCEGSVSLPVSATPADIDDWEHVWWDTPFAHTNAKARELCKHTDGHDGLWRGQVKANNFPVDTLVPALSRETHQQITLEEAINLP